MFQPPISEMLMSLPATLVVCVSQTTRAQSEYWYPTRTMAVVTPYTRWLWGTRRGAVTDEGRGMGHNTAAES